MADLPVFIGVAGQSTTPATETSDAVTVTPRRVGSLLIASTSFNTSGVTGLSADGWTLIGFSDVAAGSGGGWFYRISTGDGNDDYNPSWTTNSRTATLVHEYGPIASNPFVESSISNETNNIDPGTGLSVGTVTPGRGPGIAVAFCAVDDSNSWDTTYTGAFTGVTIDGGFTNLPGHGAPALGRPAAYQAYLSTESAADVTGTWTGDGALSTKVVVGVAWFAAEQNPSRRTFPGIPSSQYPIPGRYGRQSRQANNGPKLRIAHYGTTAGADTSFKNDLRRLGHTVDSYAQGDAAVTTGYDVIIINESVAATAITNRFRDSLIPVLNFEPGVMADMELSNGEGTTQSVSAVGVSPGADYYKAPDILKWLPVFDQATDLVGGTFLGLTSTLGAGVRELYSKADDGNKQIGIAERGAVRDDGQTFHSRRAFYLMQSEKTDSLTHEGLEITNRLLIWLAGREDEYFTPQVYSVEPRTRTVQVSRYGRSVQDKRVKHSRVNHQSKFLQNNIFFISLLEGAGSTVTTNYRPDEKGVLGAPVADQSTMYLGSGTDYKWTDSGMRFNEAGQTTYLRSNTGVDSIAGTNNDYTYAVRFKNAKYNNQGSNRNLIFSTAQDGTSNFIGVGSGDTPYLYVAETIKTYSHNLNDGQWHTIITAVDTGSGTGYVNIDGEEQSSFAYTQQVHLSGDYMLLGGDGSARDCEVEIAWAGIWNGVMPESKRRALHYQHKELYKTNQTYIIRPQYPASTDGDIAYEIPDRYMR